MRIRAAAAMVVVVSVSACNQQPSTLVNVNTEASGENCATGGVRIDTGTDQNRDGALTTDEVASTRYVCNGTTGAPGPSGQPGDAGTNGHDGHNTLVSVTSEAAGVNCQYGGSRIESGLDVNDDGALSSGEITTTRFVCQNAPESHLYFGDVRIAAQSDVAALSGFDTVVGDVFVDSEEAIDLQSLKVISGHLTVDAAPNVTASALERVGYLYINDVAIETLALPALKSALTIELINTLLSSVTFPALTSGSIDIDDNAGLQTLSLPELTSAPTLRLRNNPMLTSLSMTSLTNVRTVDFNNNGALTTVSCPALTTGGDFYFAYNDALTTITFPVLTTAGTFVFYGDDALTALSFPALTTMSNFNFHDNAGTTSLSFPALTAGESLTIINNPALTAFSTPALTTAGTFVVNDDHVLTALSLPALTTVDTFVVTNDWSLTSVTADALTTAGQFTLAANSVSTFSVTSLTTVDSMLLNSTTFTQLALPSLTSANTLTLSQNPDLTSISAPVLARLGSLSLYGLPLLDVCTLLQALNTVPCSISAFASDVNLNTCTMSDLCHSLTVPGITSPMKACLGATSFADAETRCGQTLTGGHLVWFESAAEWTSFAAGVVSGASPAGYLGYSDTATEGSFVAVSGFAAYNPTTDGTLTFFNADEPNGGTAENALEVLPTGLVNDLDPASARTALCRVP